MPSPSLPPPRHPSGPYRISLVCLGNICRSPMAEVVVRTELARAGLAGQVEVDSAGTGDWHVGQPMYRGALDELARRGYEGSGHRARQIQRSWLARYDLVLAMDLSNLADLRRMDPEAFAAGRIQLLRSFDPGLPPQDAYHDAVPDPYGGNPEEFELAFDLIEAAARGLAGQLAEFLGARAARNRP
ncbi:MAG: low molecular weight phosphotyrosine protein phosphatase [Actinobacteria bacterium]|nr:low molecular weight phosphotyrosine protein phosphatase [Actinomycetota bacterium]